MKYLWSPERPTRPARPPTSPCQAVPRSHWEAATAWPLRAPPQARTLGSEFCLQVAFLLVLGLTAGLSRTYLKNLTQKPRGKIHSVCPQTLQSVSSVRCVLVWWLLDRVVIPFHPFPILVHSNLLRTF